ncbi:MAG: HAD-IA family hydrolase [Chlorobi bacterium]|nr:HAD-IA family hydrolase [Chlorobiota bacterium]
MIISGIIFDIDGTLARTNKLIFETFRFIAEKYLHKHYTDEEIIALFGPTEEDLLREMLPPNEYEKAMQEFYAFYDYNHDKMASGFAGIAELLEFISQYKIPLAVYTGKGKVTAEITLRKENLFNYFDLIISGSEVPEPKPSQLAVDMFIEKFKLKRKEVVIIGDAIADIKTAEMSGITCLSAIWDSYAKADVKRLNPDFLFETVAELKRFLEKHLQPQPNQLNS